MSSNPADAICRLNRKSRLSGSEPTPEGVSHLQPGGFNPPSLDNVVGPVWRCPIVAYGAGDSSLDHTPHEHVDIGEWQHSVAVLADLLARIVNGS